MSSHMIVQCMFLHIPHWALEKPYLLRNTCFFVFFSAWSNTQRKKRKQKSTTKTNDIWHYFGHKSVPVKAPQFLAVSRFGTSVLSPVSFWCECRPAPTTGNIRLFGLHESPLVSIMVKNEPFGVTNKNKKWVMNRPRTTKRHWACSSSKYICLLWLTFLFITSCVKKQWPSKWNQAPFFPDLCSVMPVISVQWEQWWSPEWLSLQIIDLLQKNTMWVKTALNQPTKKNKTKKI